MQDVNVSFSRKHSKISNGGEPGGARGVAVAWELLIASRKCKNENQSAVLQGSGRNMSDWSQRRLGTSFLLIGCSVASMGPAVLWA